jgi:hypothetical protein
VVATGPRPAIAGIHHNWPLDFHPIFARIRLFGTKVRKSLLICLEISHKTTESGRFGQGADARRRTSHATSRVVETRWSN